jgi:cytochrome c5
MSARVFRRIGIGAAALAVTAAVAIAQSPADEARLKKLDAGPKTIDVSQYPAEQQRAYKLYQTKCSTCHVIARAINSEMVVPADWERYIKRMMYKPNSGISSDEGRTLYRFVAYDASARKTDLLRKALAALSDADRAAAIERIKAVNPAFVAP